MLFSKISCGRAIRLCALAGLLLVGACDTVDSQRDFTITGRVLEGGSPLADVTVRLEGGIQSVTATDAAGAFRFDGVPGGLSYTVRPESEVYGFEPGEATIGRLDTDRDFQFSAAPLEEVLDGVNLSRLFAPATSSEIQTIASDWQHRPVQSAGYRIEHEAGRESGILRIFSHLVDGHRHMSMMHLPHSERGDNLPVVVINHGGDTGIDAAEYLAYADDLGSLIQNAILVLPAFRSESIQFDDREFVSEGPASTWDRDVDDAIAAMQVVMDNEPRARPDRPGTIGFSRGGGVSLLMAIREPRIEAVVTFFGPTDFFDDYVRNVTRIILNTNQFIVPGSRNLTDVVLRPLQRGEITMSQARLELVRRSPVLFPERLPALQVHHGTGDFVVWVSQAHRLDEALNSVGRTSPSGDYELYIYDGAGHNPAELQGSLTRTTDFLFRHLTVTDD